MTYRALCDMSDLDYFNHSGFNHEDVRAEKVDVDGMLRHWAGNKEDGKSTTHGAWRMVHGLSMLTGGDCIQLWPNKILRNWKELYLLNMCWNGEWGVYVIWNLGCTCILAPMGLQD
eukprot:1659760-Amphidinium_carterae.1